MKQYKITDFTQHTDDPTSYDGTVVINGKELSVDIILVIIAKTPIVIVQV